MAAGRLSLIPSALLSSTDPYVEVQCQAIVLAPDVVSYYSTVVNGFPRWHTVPLSRVVRISWDDDPFTTEPAGDEIDYLRQFIANLSPDELEASVESLIGVGGQDKLGEWIKTALMQMVGEA